MINMLVERLLIHGKSLLRQAKRGDRKKREDEKQEPSTVHEASKPTIYLITPRLLRSTKAAISAASSPSSSLIFSTACVVFSLAASR